jgi:hypothetical protein
MTIIRTFAALVLIALSGCSGMSEQACLSADWRGIGFEDGVQGRNVGNIASYRQSCSDYGIAPDLESYRAGHAEGVEVYCRPSNGFDRGRSGARYQGVCPSGTETDFLDAFNAGRGLYDLEYALRTIDSRIVSNERALDNIKHRLVDITATIALAETAPADRVRLVAEAAELGSRFSDIENDTRALREERIVVALDLDDYRRSLSPEWVARVQ